MEHHGTISGGPLYIIEHYWTSCHFSLHFSGPPRRVTCGAAAGATRRAHRASPAFPVLPGGTGERNLVLQQV